MATSSSKCNWPKCDELVVARYSCVTHWQALPRDIRMEIARTFNPMKVKQSDEYHAAHKAVIAFAATLDPVAPPPETAQLFDDVPQPPPVDGPDPIAHVRHLPIMEQMKYGQARYVWKIRNQLSPNKAPDGEKETWQQWWERKHKQSLFDYVDFCKMNYEKPKRT